MYKLLEIKPRLSTSLAIVLVLCVVTWINENYIIGTLLSLLLLGILFLTTGFIIDKEENRIKKVTYFFGFSFGKWYSLSEIKYISLLRVKLMRKSYSASSNMYVQRSSKNYSYRVNLVYQDKRQKPFRLISTTQEKAIKEGLQLGDYLDVRVFDSTTLDRKWIR